MRHSPKADNPDPTTVDSGTLEAEKRYRYLEDDRGTVSAFTKGARVYVDECKAKGYYVAAAVVLPNDAPRLDRALRRLNRPGQRRIHFTKESDSSKRTLLSEISKLGISVVVYQVRGQSDVIARPLCLNALIDDLSTHGCPHVILERDDSIEKSDRKLITHALRRNNGYALNYEHASPADHALLWVSDMIAWCCYKGGDWQRRAESMITEIRVLTP